MFNNFSDYYSKNQSYYDNQSSQQQRRESPYVEAYSRKEYRHHDAPYQREQERHSSSQYYGSSPSPSLLPLPLPSPSSSNSNYSNYHSTSSLPTPSLSSSSSYTSNYTNYFSVPPTLSPSTKYSPLSSKDSTDRYNSFTNNTNNTNTTNYSRNNHSHSQSQNHYHQKPKPYTRPSTSNEKKHSSLTSGEIIITDSDLDLNPKNYLLRSSYSLFQKYPTFSTVRSESGNFLCTVTFPSNAITDNFLGEGKNKKEAEKVTTLKCLKYLSDHGLLPGIIPESVFASITTTSITSTTSTTSTASLSVTTPTSSTITTTTTTAHTPQTTASSTATSPPEVITISSSPNEPQSPSELSTVSMIAQNSSAILSLISNYNSQDEPLFIEYVPSSSRMEATTTTTTTTSSSSNSNSNTNNNIQASQTVTQTTRAVTPNVAIASSSISSSTSNVAHPSPSSQTFHQGTAQVSSSSPIKSWPIPTPTPTPTPPKPSKTPPNTPNTPPPSVDFPPTTQYATTGQLEQLVKMLNTYTQLHDSKCDKRIKALEDRVQMLETAGKLKDEKISNLEKQVALFYDYRYNPSRKEKSLDTSSPFKAPNSPSPPITIINNINLTNANQNVLGTSDPSVSVNQNLNVVQNSTTPTPTPMALDNPVSDPHITSFAQLNVPISFDPKISKKAQLENLPTFYLYAVMASPDLVIREAPPIIKDTSSVPIQLSTETSLLPDEQKSETEDLIRSMMEEDEPSDIDTNEQDNQDSQGQNTEVEVPMKISEVEVQMKISETVPSPKSDQTTPSSCSPRNASPGSSVKEIDFDPMSGLDDFPRPISSSEPNKFQEYFILSTHPLTLPHIHMPIQKRPYDLNVCGVKEGAIRSDGDPLKLALNTEELITVIDFHNYITGTILLQTRHVWREWLSEDMTKKLYYWGKKKDKAAQQLINDEKKIPPILVIPSSALTRKGEEVYMKGELQEVYAGEEIIDFNHILDLQRFIPYDKNKHTAHDLQGKVIRTPYNNHHYVVLSVNTALNPLSLFTPARAISDPNQPESSSTTTTTTTTTTETAPAPPSSSLPPPISYAELFKLKKGLIVTDLEQPIISVSHCGKKISREILGTSYRIMYTSEGDLYHPPHTPKHHTEEGMQSHIIDGSSVVRYHVNLIPEFCEFSSLTYRQYAVGILLLPILLQEAKWWCYLSIVMEKIGIHFKNKRRVRLGFIHPSYHQGVSSLVKEIENIGWGEGGTMGCEWGMGMGIGDEKEGVFEAEEDPSVTDYHYQRLEFLGDSVLKMVCAKLLYQKFGNQQEGQLTQRRADMVNNILLEILGRRLGVDRLLLLGSGVKPEGKAVADIVESLLACIYIEHGIDLAENFCLKYIGTCPAFMTGPSDVNILFPEQNVVLSDYFQKLQDDIGIHFSDISLLVQAFTHSSHSNHTNPPTLSYERLEFFGDAVVDLVTSSHFYLNLRDLSEGDMSQYKSTMVCNEMLSTISENVLSAENLVRHHISALSLHGSGVLSDVFESLVAAIYLDKGWEVAREFVMTYLVFPKLEEVTREVDDKILKEKALRVSQGIYSYETPSLRKKNSKQQQPK